eukprot:Nitzschia sp. Nitz4//scaffold6_size259037//85919//88111//NITZ4_001063-RA/size259037-processed-gene-0.11-mRNA-1//1//CDS//3329556860//4871//frame0
MTKSTTSSIPTVDSTLDYNGPWSIAPNKKKENPELTSLECYNALVHLFQNESSVILDVATEASSHVSGLSSLMAQPWVYAGGGLGNIDECPMQVCLAGGTKRDSLTFAAVCVVPECTAGDLYAPDFTARLEAASFHADVSKDHDIVNEYVTLHQRIAQVNHFLHTGWVCGEYKVAWEKFPSAIYILVLLSCIAFSIYSTFIRRRKPRTKMPTMHYPAIVDDDHDDEEKKSSMDDHVPSEVKPFLSNGSNNSYHNSTSCNDSFWNAWNMRNHTKKLVSTRPDTACLDGLKVGSILWVILGHVLAIESSSGPGYLNPAGFLPPKGLTTTFVGQLLFSSRFAVDTFLCVSGYLVVRVLQRKLDHPSCTKISLIILYRVLRILPLYVMCLGFWVLIAPHLGWGPFWYQWENFLEPCRQYWWTNILFINNFWPWNRPTTDTCFYHSWYLAVDVQLFVFLTPWLVILYAKSRSMARRVTLVLWAISVIVTAILTYERNWSVNTFDGQAVALFDVEGYAKPHVRAQSYLAGMRACNFEEWPIKDQCGSMWSQETTFLYAAFCRAVWSVCIGTIIYLCVQNRGSTVGRLLSWSLWTPLAQLSFGVYLIHPMIIFVWKLGSREKTSFQLFGFLMNFVSVSVASFVLSAFATFTIEFPFSDLLRPKKAEAPKEQEMEPTSSTYQLSSTLYGSTNNHCRVE